jgi:hypothetical protein
MLEQVSFLSLSGLFEQGSFDECTASVRPSMKAYTATVRPSMKVMPIHVSPTGNGVYCSCKTS